MTAVKRVSSNTKVLKFSSAYFSLSLRGSTYTTWKRGWNLCRELRMIWKRGDEVRAQLGDQQGPDRCALPDNPAQPCAHPGGRPLLSRQTPKAAAPTLPHSPPSFPGKSPPAKAQQRGEGTSKALSPRPRPLTRGLALPGPSVIHTAVARVSRDSLSLPAVSRDPPRPAGGRGGSLGGHSHGRCRPAGCWSA